MEAVETPAQRQARQFAQLRRVGHIAMALAESSGNAALVEIEQPSAPAPTPRRPDYIQTFTAAERALRQVIALELRVEAGPLTARRTNYRSPTQDDPRRPLLRDALHKAVKGGPDAARRRREADEVIDAHLLADPSATDLIEETLFSICHNLGVNIDVSKLPDALIGLAPILGIHRDPDPPNAPS